MIPIKKIVWLGVIALLLFSLVSPYHQHLVAMSDPESPWLSDQEPIAEQWLIRWQEGQPTEQFKEESLILSYDADLGVTLAEPTEKEQLAEWVERWYQADDIVYMQPNHRVTVSAKPNDELLRFQPHLAPIQVEKAWDTRTANTSMIIALVDTGVDLEHPDLKANLISGKNLLDEKAPPQDDHGHGTSLAGILAAEANNRTGIAGILWDAKIMPVKALESDGSGSEERLGRGIKYAVDHGAKIVVLSLGLYKYSNYLYDIVTYAESKGVLLVAASGNNGQAVKYPAAYPTVLAVGGVGVNKQVEAESNRGPELDIVAPWRVFTTTLGGGYDYNEGTSMAAPQVAAVAALVWAQHPEWKPYQVRNHLKQTAEDLGTPGWDVLSGDGLLRADRAVTLPYKADYYEPNNTREQAKNLSIDSMIVAQLADTKDTDWYKLVSPYDGQIALTFQAGSAAELGQMKAEYIVNGRPTQSFDNLSKPIQINTYVGTGYLKVSAKSSLSKLIQYQVTTKFTIYRDAFEDNDRQYKAFNIPKSTRSIVGTFHQLNDQDWFSYQVEENGTLQFKVSGDSYRMDLALWIQREGSNTPLFVDLEQEGLPEISKALDVLPGKYYVRVTNEAVSQESHPVAGEYNLFVEYAKKLTDPNEPNNKAFQATVMSLDTTYEGNFTDKADEDWYSFKVKSESYVKLDLTDIPVDRVMSVVLLDSKQKQLHTMVNEFGKNKQSMEHKLPAGTYYLRLTANQGITKSLYHLRVKATPLVSGFRDIASHWARGSITELVKLKMIKGYSDDTFRPDASITRAEVAQVMASALGLNESANVQFIDMSSGHWAYTSVSKVFKAGIIMGYPDGSFHPDAPISRAEMAVMLGRALQMKEQAVQTSPFTDVPVTYWALPWIKQLQEDGWLQGYSDGTYRPEAGATRAEYVTLIYRWVKQR